MIYDVILPRRTGPQVPGAAMCGVSNMLVDSMRPQLKDSFSSSDEKRMGADGKERHVRRKPAAEAAQEQDEQEHDATL